jgi:hypothetical protein
MSKLTAAYLAGFVDGEGYISLKRDFHNYRGEKVIYFTAVLKVANTNKEIIEWCKASFGGWIYKRIWKNGENHKDAYCWQLTGSNLEPFLKKILPYLKIKKEQAKLVLEKIKNQKLNELPYKNISRINDRRLDKMDRNSEYRTEIRKENENLYWKLRGLNKRGKIMQCERLNETTLKKDTIV